MQPEAWLRGPVPNIDPYLMPAAHILLQAEEEIERAVEGLTLEQVWSRPGGAASIGFHLRHIAGSMNSLMIYARGGQLSDEQRAAIALQGEPGMELSELLSELRAAIANAMDHYRATPREMFLEARGVGRAKLPSNVFGILVHAAEHTQRHTGQIVTTAKIVKAMANY
ncbi:MAG: DinB family protein [Chlorobi bacterium]|nr:MAG: DinB superfamily protein [Chlorobi bacterium OLB7]MBK8911660.1 DinB family protein [Chlorobiota bacterium]MBX7216594.1 DinB family protein [Candidatus Kapabacteria bacterium]